MTSRQALSAIEWHVEGGVAVAYRLDEGGWLVMYAFVRLEGGLIDLASFRVEPYLGEPEDLPDAVQRMVGEWRLSIPAQGLTTRRLRVMLTSGDMLTQARAELRKLAPFAMLGTRVRTGNEPTHDDRFYAELALTYSDLMSELGPRGGARRALAEHYTQAETTVENWIKESKARGFWLTAGRGRAGQASDRARQVATGDDR